MVFRIYSEKKKGQRLEAESLFSDLKNLLCIKGLEDLRIINRYDVEDIDKELFDYAVKTVFSEPQLDDVYDEINDPEAYIFCVEFLPGQFDQRADSAAQCIQLISKGEKPAVRSARVYLLYGTLSDEDIKEIKKYVINPVEAREASPEIPETLKMDYEIPKAVAVLDGFTGMDKDDLKGFIKEYGLAMDEDDLEFCRNYFLSEKRDPTITEIKMIDTYWSDHCRHTTFLTVIDDVRFNDPLLKETYEDYLNTRKEVGDKKDICLMDLATVAVKYLKKTGQLTKLDESDEINACTVKINVTVDGREEPWLLLFKNETHNHPTEIEPFGGAATCIGGAIRDPLSGRAYVYSAMRLTGASDPTVPVTETMEGKLPQRKIVTTAAAGYSSYGNQIGLTTGMVDEIYHPGFAAKRMEVGAVVAAAPAENVIREEPVPGDKIILLGGATGRDGIGGATGASKAHDSHSVETCGAEVQKGNAPEERKMQRLFRDPEATRLIKRCNDFGAGGVSVAIGELADGLLIDLNKVPKKYEGLDGTELAISESQERMAVVVAASSVDRFLELAARENLQATVVAEVKEEKRLTMLWNNDVILDLSREFLNSNGAEKHIEIDVASPSGFEKDIPEDFKNGYLSLAGDLNICSKRGLSERFDSTIGAGTVLMPFGGKYQRTPIQAMVQKVAALGETDDCSVMSWGYDPFISEKSPYHGAYLAVIQSVAKLLATGGSFKDIYLSFQEYFGKPGHDSARWGDPMAAMLGSFRAQKELGIGSIGGKDSMSGTFEDLDVPPTLISFAITTDKADVIISPEFKKAGSKVWLLEPAYGNDGLPEKEEILRVFGKISDLTENKDVLSCYTPGMGGIAEAVMKMAMGNGFGFRFDDGITMDKIFGHAYGSFIIESDKEIEGALLLGEVKEEAEIVSDHGTVSLKELEKPYEEKLESVFPCNIKNKGFEPDTVTFNGERTKAPAVKAAVPKVLIPVFPGTNCEYDSARAVSLAGGDPDIFVIKNLSSSDIERSIEDFSRKLAESQIVFIPGGFSGGDEPEGSGKFITAFFRNEAIKEGVTELLERRDGLMCGICNGFQALIKLGLVPFGKITDTDENCPTLTFNTIGRHQSKIIRTRIVSNISPWLSETNVGDIYSAPISHGEGRFFAPRNVVEELFKNGQVATQYVDLEGKATTDIQFNPNDSMAAIEGITSPDGRVFGKMGHAERTGKYLYKNVPGDYDIGMFRSAIKYFK